MVDEKRYGDLGPLPRASEIPRSMHEQDAIALREELVAARQRIATLEAALLEAASMKLHWSSRAKQAKFRQLVTGETPPPKKARAKR